MAAHAAYVVVNPGEDSNCSAVLVVFVRGSGQNNSDIYKVDDSANSELNEIYREASVNSSEKQTAEFFKDFHAKVPTGVKYVSLHNQNSSTGQTYNQYGYAAVSAFDAISGPFNTLNKPPLHRKDVANRYYESVKDGAEELAWYLEDQLTSCPLQRVVLGGYSQGAEVVADGINIMQPDFRARIADVALYGDPKFNPREDGSLTKGPWVRGNARFVNTTGGILSPRRHYVPDGIASLGSWCAASDKICDAGVRDSRTILNSIADETSSGNTTENNIHSDIYQSKWIAQSMSEIVRAVQNAVPNQYVNIRSNVYVNKNDKLWDLDLAVVIDNSSAMQAALQTVKGNVTSISSELLGSYWNSRVGIVTYGGLPAGYTDPSYQYTDVITPFTNDTGAVRQGIQSITAQQPFYGLLTDGTSYQLTEQSAQYAGIMTAIQNLQWEHGAQKKIIVITNKPASSPDPSPSHWTADQVKQAAFSLDPAALNLANVSCDNTWSCDYSVDQTFQDLANASAGQLSDVNLAFGTVDDLQVLLQSMATQPVAKVTGDQTGYMNTPVNLNADESYDPDNALTEYDWDCTSDGQWDSVWSWPTNACTYSQPGDYLVTLRVWSSDDQQAALATWPVHISAGPSPTMPAAPEKPAVSLTYGDSLRLTWSNAYSSNVYIQVADDQDNLLGYAPGNAQGVALNGIGNEVPELHISACTDMSNCSDSVSIALNHDELDNRVASDDASVFTVYGEQNENGTTTNTETTGTIQPDSTATETNLLTPIVISSASNTRPTPVADNPNLGTSVLGEHTVPQDITKQFSKHAHIASDPTKKASFTWLTFAMIISGLALTLFVFVRLFLKRNTTH